MNIYAIQVSTGEEEKFLKLWEARKTFKSVNVYWPKREITIHRQGKKLKSIVPVFPGYVFVEADAIDDSIFYEFCKIPYFHRFLRDNLNILPLPEPEQRVLFQITKFGRVIGKSTATYNENDRIVILEGPLKGLEGLIIKVDKRKNRVKVRLNMYEDSFLVDFAFDLIAGNDK